MTSATVRHFLYVGGGIPFANYSLGDYISNRAYIGNIGNFMFINAVIKSLMVDDEVEFWPTWYRHDFTDKEVAFANSYYDAFILPLADAFRADNVEALKGLTSFIRKLKIPCYVIGVGLRAPYHVEKGDSNSFDDIVADFMKAVLDKSAIVGIRGATTGEYLQRLGFVPEKHFTVIGCPSVSVFVPSEKVEPLTADAKKTILIMNTLAPRSVSDSMLATVRDWNQTMVVAQKQMELEDIYLGRLAAIQKRKGRIVENVFGDELYNMLYREGRIKTFSNFPSWVKEVSGSNLCISTRFHGSIAAMIDRIPTVVIPIDSRMREMVEYHQLPSIPFDQVEDLCDQIYEVDFNRHLSVWQRNREHYIEFLSTNGLENIFDKSYENGQTPYDKAVAKVDWKTSAKNFSEVGTAEKIHRILYYYGGKVRSKLKQGDHSIIV